MDQKQNNNDVVCSAFQIITGRHGWLRFVPFTDVERYVRNVTNHGLRRYLQTDISNPFSLL